VSLSICLITADPPERVSTILEPLRPYADEVLIAADSRVDEQTLAGYDAVADRLFRIKYVVPERHLAWMFAQCSGDWILRLDGDEAPSAALVRRLPELLASREVQQFWIRRAWLYSDANHWLASAPWSEDFVNRLMRNDGTLRVGGRQHRDAEPVTPREYVQEALYHFDLLTTSHKRRRDKAVHYEVSLPGLMAQSGGRLNEAFYLPELQKSLELSVTPEEDRALIARMLTAKPPPERHLAIDEVPLVSLQEMDRFWEGRSVADGAYHARIEPYESTVALTPGQPRSVFLHVGNEGTERWPSRLEEKPAIRLGYRWLNFDGSPRGEEGPRSPFPRSVNPGERILAPLDVVAPAEPGEYVLEADIVHEDVRWFGCACRIRARVEDPPDLPPAGVRLCETSPPRLQRWRRVRIPRTIHRVWLGTAAVPEEHQRFGDSFAEHHPGWEMRLWTDADLPELDITAADRERSRTHSELSNLVRYEVLHRFGGVYADTDVECQRPLTPLLKGIDAFAALELPGRVCTAILGAVPGHPVFGRATRLTRETLGTGLHSAIANGPYLLSLLLEQEPGFAIFAKKLFYPYLWDEPERRHEAFPDAYTIHHWALSWVR
jgi:inositol phosphorylceramide mannosyltransferase catalytic subunit